METKKTEDNPMKTDTSTIFATALLLITVHFSGGVFAETYIYDKMGRLTNVSYPSGASVAYNYDANSNVTRITHTGVVAPMAPDGVIDTPADDVTITAGDSIDFTGTGGDPDGAIPLTFRWDFGGGAAESTDEDPGLTAFSDVGTYTVEFFVTDATGITDPTPDTVVVTVEAAAAPSPPPPALTVQVEASSGGGSVLWLPIMLALLALRRLVRRSLMVSFLMMSAFAAQAADWAPMNSPTAVDLQDVWGASSDNVYAVGDGGTILFFDGSSWAEIDSGVAVNLNSVWGRSADDVYAVGQQGSVLHFDGQSWTTIDIGAGAQELVDVWSAGPGERLWVIAKRGAWYFDGVTWTQQGFTEFLSRSFTPNAILTAIGGTPNFPVVTSIQLSGAFIGFFVKFKGIADWSNNAIWAFSDTEMFAVGLQSKRLDGGDATKPSSAVWRDISIMDRPLGVWGTAPNDMFSVGHHFNNGRISHYDGNVDDTWDSMYELMSTKLHAVFGFAPTDVFVVGERGTILRYFDAPLPETAANFSFSAMASPFVNAHTGELVVLQQDFNLGHLLPVTFERYYASGLLNEPRVGGQLGRNWTHTYEWRMIEGDNDGPPEVTVITNKGRVINFEQIGLDWELVSPLSTAYSLTPLGVDFIFADPESERMWRFNRDSGKLLSIEDRNGNKIFLNYNQGVLVSVDDRKGNEIGFVYSGVNRLGGIYTIGGAADPNPRYDITFEYVDNNLTQVTDATGRVITYEYVAGRENEALLEAIQLPESRERTWFYNDRHQVVAEQIIGGGEFTYNYGELSTIATNPDTLERSYSHDDNGALTRFEDELANVSTYEYNPDGRRTVFTDRIGRRRTWTYHGGSFKVETVTRPDQLEYRFIYEEKSSNAGVPFYDVVSINNPDGTSVSMQHDANGNMTLQRDQENNEWTYTHNAEGQVLTETNPLGGVTEYGYWSHGASKEVIDNAGNRTSYFYDGYRRQNSIEFADLTRRSIVLNGNNNIEKLTTEAGEVFDFKFTADGRLSQVTTSSGETATYTYDARGSLIEIVQPRAGFADTITVMAYDDFGRPQQMTKPDATLLNYRYDKLGRVNKIIDGKNESWTLVQDAEGTTKSVSHSNGDSIQFDNSDNALRLNTKVTNGDEKSSATLDEMGRLDALFDANEAMTDVERNARGLVTKVTAPEPGIVTQIDHNKLGQVVAITDPNGGKWKKDYDQQGRVKTFEDPLGQVTTINYDKRNRPSNVDLPGNAGELTISYDENNRVKRQQFTDGTDIELDHDTKGRPKSGTGVVMDYDTRGNMSESNGIIINYDENDRIAKINLAPGRFIEYKYDERGNLNRIKDWLGGETVIGRTQRGQPEDIALPNGIHNGYEYDRAGRVKKITYGAVGSISLQRDWRGFITSANRDLPGPNDIESDVRAFDFDAASQVSRFSYDTLGNLIQDDDRGYDFNLASRLLGFDGDTGGVTNGYDAFGNRVSSESAGRSRSYVWNYAGGENRVAVEQEAGQDLWYYVYTTSGRLLYRINGDGVRQHYHFDENGSTVLMTDNDGNVIATYFYSPFGEILDESGNVDNDRKFNAEVGGMAMPDSDMVVLGGRLLDTIDARGVAQVHRYANQALNDRPEVSNDGQSPYQTIARDAALTGAGLTASTGEKLVKMKPLVGSLFKMPVQKIALSVLKGLGAAVNIVGSVGSGIDEYDSMPYRSEGAKVIGAAGVTFSNALAGSHPVTAALVLTGNIADAASLYFFDDIFGALDVWVNNPSRVVATAYDATIGGGGWDSVKMMSDHVHNEQGILGAIGAAYADYVVGPALGEAYNLYSGETFRTFKLEAQIWIANH